VADRKGNLLAFAEGRAGGESDQAANKIILKVSRDHGQSWGPLSVVEDDGSNSLNNPCAVLDQSTGRIFLMYQRVPSGLSEGSSKIADGYDSPNAYRSLLTWTDNGGTTWQTPEDVTRFVKRPTGVKTICSGPGIGIQLTRGSHRGRLIIPFNEGPYGHWNNYAVFSDDHGKHWHMGENAPGAQVPDAKGHLHSQVNEVQMAELSDGSVLFNSRQFAGNAVRKQAVSHDGGATWSDVTEAPELRDPSCMGSLLRYRFGRHDSGVLLYSGPDSAKRENGTLYASFDDGKTWPLKKLLIPGDFAYSVLIALPGNEIGCLYETDNYRKIQFTRFHLEPWLHPSRRER
jgi:sialidase-1